MQRHNLSGQAHAHDMRLTDSVTAETVFLHLTLILLFCFQTGNNLIRNPRTAVSEKIMEIPAIGRQPDIDLTTTRIMADAVSKHVMNGTFHERFIRWKAELFRRFSHCHCNIIFRLQYIPGESAPGRRSSDEEERYHN